MVQITTAVLEQRKSGSIDIIWNGVFAAVQFNCDCTDAVHLCHGMCCKRRSGYSVELTSEEVGKYWSDLHPTKKSTHILMAKKDGMSCIYLDDEKGTCTIYDRRPQMCRQWHCSPQGSANDKEIERRDAGWMLLPVRKEEANFVQLRRA